MTSLVDVWLHYNNFEGAIPNVSMLTKLEDFCVRDNKLYGPVPESLVGLPSLKIVNLSNNLFQGKMPKFGDKIEVENFGNNKYCTNSPDMDCDQNVKDLWKIAELLKLPPKHFKNWDGNDVCGWNGIACDITKKNVTVISFQNMNLTGTIPHEFTNFTSLERLYLQNNNLIGTLPDEFGVMPRLILIDVSYNQIINNLPIFRSKVVVQGALTIAGKSFLKNIAKRKSLWKKNKLFEKSKKSSGKKSKKEKQKKNKDSDENDFEMPDMDIHC